MVGVDDGDRILSSVRGEDEPGPLVHEGAGDAREALERAHVPRRVEIDDVERVIRGVGDVEPAGLAVESGVVEAARSCVRWELDVPLQAQGHPAATWSLAHAYSAS